MKRDVELLENVQKRAVRCIQGLHGTYEEKLKQINLPLLVDRRLRGDLIQTYKIVHTVDDVDPATWFKFAAEVRRPTRGNTQIDDDGSQAKRLTLEGRKCNSELRRNFFSNRVVQPWNELPDAVKSAESVNAFKNGYDKYLTAKE